MNTMTMAARNLGRNKRRSFLAALSVFIAILLVVVLDGLTSGFLDSMARNFTKNETGHVNVATAEYRARERFMPVSAAISDSQAVVKAIRQTPGLENRIAQVTERVRFGVVLSSATASKAAIGLGGDPAAERKLLMLDKVLLPGSSYCEAPGTAIVGERLAGHLGLGVGDVLKVVTQRADYGLGFKKFRIVGLFRTGVRVFDDATFQVGLDDARELLGLGAGASQVVVMLDNYKDSDRAAGLIAAFLASSGFEGLSVRSWTSLGDVARVISYASSIYFWAWLIVAFLGAFIIANVMMMVVLERRREIGILKAMGMGPGRILGLFFSEGIMLGVIGAAGGAIVGTLLTAYLAAKGVDFSKAISGTDFPMDNIIHPAVHLGKTLVLFGLGVVVSAIVAYLPARGAARMDPIEAIRSV
jgi:putative ABC transport system permease protein